MSTTISRPVVTTLPASEPITVAEAKKQLELAASDDTHDQHLIDIIRAAREQWEHDTDSAVMTQTLTLNVSGFRGSSLYLPSRPIQSITSIKYLDTGNTQQTLSTDIYELDAPARAVRLKYNQVWPSTLDHWNAVEVIYVAGHTSRQLVPEPAKQAIKLSIGYYFEANRGDNDRPNDQAAYHRLVARYMRASYP